MAQLEDGLNQIKKPRPELASYLDAAVTALREVGTEVKDEDLARLSPLKAKHLNVLGRYSFLPAVPGGGMLWALRDPADADADTEDDV